jgi:hypothetical protein
MEVHVVLLNVQQLYMSFIPRSELGMFATKIPEWLQPYMQHEPYHLTVTGFEILLWDFQGCGGFQCLRLYFPQGNGKAIFTWLQHKLQKFFISGIIIHRLCPQNVFCVEFAPFNNIDVLVPLSYILYHDTEFLCHSAVVGFFCMYNFHSFKICVVTVIH